MICDPMIEIPSMTEMMAEMAAVDEVEIVQHVKPREIEIRPEERVRSPRVQIAVVHGRRIVGHYGRTLLIIIVIDFRRRHIFIGLRRLGRSVLIRRR